MKQKGSFLKQVRKALFQAIHTVAANLDVCVKRPGKDFSRTRKLPLTTMLLMLVGMGGGSMAKELCEWFDYSTDTATVSAFTQQRDKIRPEALEMVFRQFTEAIVPAFTFRGYRLFAVDGSDLRLPSNAADQFSSIRNSASGKNYNLVHLNAMYDLMGKAYVDATMQPKKGMNEHGALVSMVERSKIDGNVIVVMDRGYESFNNIAHFQEKSWNYVIRAKGSHGIISGLSLPDAPEFDEEITLTLTRRQTKETLALLSERPDRYRWLQTRTTFDYIKPKDPTFYGLHFRAVRFQIGDGVYETVYTNLDPEDFPPQTIKELYRLRWGIETSFRELKYAVGLASLHSKKKDSMSQEVFARLTFYNYASLIARHIDAPNGKQINFSAAVPLCRRFLKERSSAEQTFANIARHVSPIRPGRQFHRCQNSIPVVAFQYRLL